MPRPRQSFKYSTLEYAVGLNIKSFVPKYQCALSHTFQIFRPSPGAYSFGHIGVSLGDKDELQAVIKNHPHPEKGSLEVKL